MLQPTCSCHLETAFEQNEMDFFFLRQSLEDFCFQATFSKFNLLSVDSLLGKVSYVASSLPNSPFCCYFYSEVVCNIYILYP